MTRISQHSSIKVSWGERLVIAFPILAFISMIWIYAVNVPWLDDVDVFPDFLGKFLSSNNWDERWYLLFKPNNEHRVVYAKLANLLHYALTGTLNMRTLTIASNVTLFGILWIFWRIVRENKLKAIYFIPIPFILLQPQYYLTSLWTITGFQYQPVIFWGLMGMYLLSRQTIVGFITAIFLVFFDSFTMSNGMFYWIAGLVILCLQGRYKELLVWAIFMLLTIKIYFLNFSNEANDLGFKYFAQHPHESFFGFFTHLGGSFDFFTDWEIFKRSVLPTIAGAIMVSIVGIWIIAFLLFSDKLPFSLLKLSSKENYFKRLHQRISENSSNYIILGGLIFLLINALVIAILRPRFGYFVMIVGNYKIYPAMFFAFTYVIVATTWLKEKSHIWIKGIIGLAIVFNILSYGKFLPEVHERRKDLLTRVYNQQYNQIGLGPAIHTPFYDYVNQAMGRLTAQGIYTYPKGFYTGYEQDLSKPLSNFPDLKVDIHPTPDGIVIDEKSLVHGKGLNDGTYLILKSQTRTYLFYQKSPHWWGRTYQGSSTLIPIKTYEPDKYKIGVIHVLNNQVSFFDTKQEVELKL